MLPTIFLKIIIIIIICYTGWYWGFSAEGVFPFLSSHEALLRVIMRRLLLAQVYSGACRWKKRLCEKRGVGLLF